MQLETWSQPALGQTRTGAAPSAVSLALVGLLYILRKWLGIVGTDPKA